MIKNPRSLIVLSLLLSLLCHGMVAANSREDKTATKVKAAIAKLGTGPEARIEVKLRDKTKLKGYVSEISEDHFAVVDDRTGAVTQVTYPQVKKVKGNNLSTGAKIGIGIGIAVLVIYGILVGLDQIPP